MSSARNSPGDARSDGPVPPSPAGRVTARARTLRYGDVVLAYAGLLCATPRAAHTLAADVLDGALDAVLQERARSSSWVCVLLGEARLLAADWADSGRDDDLSADFRAWLSVRRTAHRSYREVVAEADGPLQGALAQLPDLPATEVWRALTPATGGDRPAAARPAPSEQARRALADAYVRAHAAGAPERRCRHLAALLAEVAGSGTAPTAELAAHLAQCHRCHGALDDLRAVHRWDGDRLRTGLLACFRPEPTDRRTAAPAATATATATPAFAPEEPTPPQEWSADIVLTPDRSRPGRPGRHAVARRRIAVGTAGVGTLALAIGFAMAGPLVSHVAEPQQADRTPVTADDLTPVPTTESATPLPPAPAPSSPSAPATPSPRRSKPAPASPPSGISPTTAPPAPTTPPGVPSDTVTPAPPSTPPTPTAPPPAPQPTSPAPSPSATAPTVRVLRLGDSGAEVLQLQRLLVKAGCAPGDSVFQRGRFDAATGRVLAGFQQAAGIRGDERADGVYGALTRAALELSATVPGCKPGQVAHNR
ncbi:peptidoglycan-binding protein [Kitasatospora sp. NPDC059327]|uniref:peptidoglycan-binding domain-containing protein n=1 Tax=Kitasatospora sp. NPDC059327 TaxID=3346803 RepID=UPI0036C95F46